MLVFDKIVNEYSVNIRYNYTVFINIFNHIYPEILKGIQQKESVKTIYNQICFINF